jgi:cell shape-determining protein MreC
VLLEGMKEQQVQIESVKQENQLLKSQLDELKNLVNSLIANQTAQVNK